MSLVSLLNMYLYTCATLESWRNARLALEVQEEERIKVKEDVSQIASQTLISFFSGFHFS